MFLAETRRGAFYFVFSAFCVSARDKKGVLPLALDPRLRGDDDGVAPLVPLCCCVPPKLKRADL